MWVLFPHQVHQECNKSQNSVLLHDLCHRLQEPIVWLCGGSIHLAFTCSYYVEWSLLHRNFSCVSCFLKLHNHIAAAVIHAVVTTEIRPLCGYLNITELTASVESGLPDYVMSM